MAEIPFTEEVLDGPGGGVTRTVGTARDGLIAAIAYHIGDLDAGQVDRMTAAHYFWASRRWLATAEDMPGHRFVYLTVKDPSGRLLGLLPCQHVTDESTPDFYDIPRMIAKSAVFGTEDWLSQQERAELRLAQTAVAGGVLYPSLVAAAPNSCCPIAYEPTLAPAERDAVTEALLALFTKAAAELEAVTVGALFLYPEAEPGLFGPLAGAFDAAGYRPVTLGGDCVLPVRWPDFNGYLNQFHSSRRNAIKRERRDFTENGFSIRVRRGAHLLNDHLADLQVSHRRKYGDQGVDVTAVRETFAHIRRSLGEEMVIFTAERDERVIGFIAFFEYGPALYARVTGFDHELLSGHDFCYFNVVYYEPLVWAAAHGLSRIHYGFATYEAKLRRGCEMHRALGYIAVSGRHAEPALTAARLLSASEQRRLDHVEARSVSAPPQRPAGARVRAASW